MTMTKMIVALAAAGLVSTVAYAGPSGSPAHSNMKHQPVQTLKMRNEAFVTGNGLGAALTQFDYTPIDSGTVLHCKKACVISADATSQLQTAGADWAICIALDGSYIECQYQGVQAGPSSYVMGNAGASAAAAIGDHTVQTFLYTESASATYQYYAMHYAVHQ